MGFRNPVTTAVDPTARDLANQALTEIIPGSRLAADAIDGKTITGATLRTAAAGQRLQMNSAAGLVTYDASGNVISSLAPGGKFSTFAPSGGQLVVDGNIGGGSNGGGLLWNFGGTAGAARCDNLLDPFTHLPNGRQATLNPGSVAGYAGTPATVVAQTTASGSLIQLNADTVTQSGDTTWTALTPTGTWSATTGIFYKIHGGFCTVIVGAINPAGWAANNVIAVLPAGARPTEPFWVIGNISGGPAYTDVEFLTNGNIQIINAASGSNDIRFSTTFPLGS